MLIIRDYECVNLDNVCYYHVDLDNEFISGPWRIIFYFAAVSEGKGPSKMWFEFENQDNAKKAFDKIIDDLIQERKTSVIFEK